MSELNIPESWVETNLENALTLINGRAYKQTEFRDKGTPIIRIQNLNKGDKWFYSDFDLPEDKYCESGDLLFAWSASFGPYIWDGPRAIYHYHIWKIINRHGIERSYAFYYLEFLTQMVKNNAHGLAMLHITKEKMEKMPFLLPPTKEQERLVHKIESCFSKIEATEQSLNKVEILLEKYRESLLAKAFRGELIPQNPDDEPASVLLAKIREERAQNQKGKKKEQEFSPISDEEKPFDIPDSWEWVRFGELGEFINGYAFKSTDFVKSGGTQLVRMGNVTPEGLDLEKSPVFLPATYLNSHPHMLLKANDLLISLTGTIGKEDFGNAVMVRSSINLFLNQRILAIRSNISDYIYWLVKFPYFRQQFFKLGKGQRQSNVSPVELANLVVPLPSDRQMKSIVLQLDKMELLCFEIKTSLNKKYNLVHSLKNGILTKAFEGRLVDQIASEGTGHELLQKILKQKDQEKSAKESTKKKVSKKVSKKKTTKK